MQPSAYVQAFEAKGVVLWREGDSLKYRAPDGVLTPPVLAKLAKAKGAILPLLPSAPPSPEPVQAVATAPVVPVAEDPPPVSAGPAAFACWVQREQIRSAGASLPRFAPLVEAELLALGKAADAETELDLLGRLHGAFNRSEVRRRDPALADLYSDLLDQAHKLQRKHSGETISWRDTEKGAAVQAQMIDLARRWSAISHGDA